MDPQKSNQRTALDYLKRVEELGIEPNFWTSLDYLQFCGAEIMEESGWIWPAVDGWALLPLLPISELTDWRVPDITVWSDWNSSGEYCVLFETCGTPTPLDWEYLYDPFQFQDLSGSKWAIFRKNIRKFPARYGEPCYCEKLPHWTDKVLELVLDWSRVPGASNGIEDEEVIVNYITKGGRCKTLWVKGILVGVNIWDSNYRYINFRYSFYNPNFEFVSEYLRWRFFTDPLIANQGKMINDGGTLGNPGLEKFKDRLNPIRKRMVNSWRKFSND